MNTSLFISGLGIITLVYLTLRFSRFVYLYTRPSSLQKYRYGNEPWALVTGASDGIGFGFARELALHGFNVVLHGRNSSKLDKRVSQLNRELPNVQYRTLVADASAPSSKQFENIVTSIKDLHLTILINNVGLGSVCKPLEDFTTDEVDAMMNLNARFPTQLTRALLPLLTRKNNGRSLIMNIGSMGTDGVPYAVPYGGSKAFCMSMSKSLDVELRVEGKEVEVLAIPIGKVTDVGHCHDPATFFTPTATTMARAALGRVGCGRAEVVGYVGHAMQKFVFGALPPSARESVIVPVMKGIREKMSRNEILQLAEKRRLFQEQKFDILLLRGCFLRLRVSFCLTFSSFMNVLSASGNFL